VESNVEGKPRPKRGGENTMRKDGYRVQFGTATIFFQPDVLLSVLPPLMNMATRGGSVQPARLVVYTFFDRFSLMFVVLSR